MTLYDPVLEQLTQSPKLGLYIQRLEQVLQTEQAKRQAFYRHITEQDKAEFINGQMIMHSPVKLRHNRTGKFLLKLLDTHVSNHKLGFVGYEKLMVSLTRNDYEPDLCFFRQEVAEAFTADQMLFPAPDFVVEILSPSTAANDRGVKLEDYAAHGIAEYWIIDPDAELLEQYLLDPATDTYRLERKPPRAQSRVRPCPTSPSPCAPYLTKKKIAWPCRSWSASQPVS
jgi:Uma2 family endonuclease